MADERLWTIGRPLGFAAETVRAERFDIDGGCAVFYNGTLLDRTVITAYGNTHWTWVSPIDEDDADEYE